MDFQLNEEQQMMVETARRIGEAYGPDYWRDLDARKAFPAEIWKAICEAGLCGIALPEEHGGSGLGMLRGKDQADLDFGIQAQWRRCHPGVC